MGLRESIKNLFHNNRLYSKYNMFPYDDIIPISLFCVNLGKNLMGNFIFWLPLAASSSGIVFTLIFEVVICVFSLYSFFLIAYLGMITESRSYSEILKKFGSFWVYLLDLNIFLVNVLSNTGYVLNIHDSISIILATWGLEVRKIIIDFVFVYFILFPFCCLKGIKSNRFLSVVGFFLMFCIVIISVTTFFGNQSIVNETFKISTTSFQKTIYILPGIAGAFDAHTNAHVFFNDFYHNSSKRGMRRYFKYVFSTFFLVLILYILFTIFTSLQYGQYYDIKLLFEQNIYLNYLIIIPLISSYVLFANSAKVSLHNIFVLILGREPHNAKFSYICEILTFTSITFLISAAKPDIQNYLNVTWSIIGTPILFIVPCVAAIAHKAISSKLMQIFNMIVLIYGVVFSMICGTIFTFIM